VRFLKVPRQFLAQKTRIHNDTGELHEIVNGFQLILKFSFQDTVCSGDCNFVQPPNAILSIPPPPLPSFLLPKSSDSLLPGNNHSQPCFAAFMCESSLGGISADHSGIEYIEIPRNTNIGIEEPWFFVLITSLCGILFLGAVFSIILMKCRDSNCSYHDTNLKNQMTFSRERDPNGNSKAHGYVMGNGGQLMPAYNPPLPVLWATLTPHGTTQHYVSEPFPQEDHYEAVDYNRKQYQACVNDLNKSFTTPKKTLTVNPASSKVRANCVLLIEFPNYRHFV